jgi:hypothetical protein
MAAAVKTQFFFIIVFFSKIINVFLSFLARICIFNFFDSLKGTLLKLKVLTRHCKLSDSLKRVCIIFLKKKYAVCSCDAHSPWMP